MNPACLRWSPLINSVQPHLNTNKPNSWFWSDHRLLIKELFDNDIKICFLIIISKYKILQRGFFVLDYIIVYWCSCYCVKPLYICMFKCLFIPCGRVKASWIFNTHQFHIRRDSKPWGSNKRFLTLLWLCLFY